MECGPEWVDTHRSLQMDHDATCACLGVADGDAEAVSGRLLRAGGIARVSGGTDGAADAESGMGFG